MTKIFCTRYDSANTSSALGSCNFGPLADLTISVFQRSEFQTPCLPKSTLLIGSKDDPWEELACESLCTRTLSSTRFSLNSCNHSGMSEYGLPRTCSWSSFLFGFGISVGSCNNSSGVSEVYGFLRACLSTFSLDSIAGWWSEWSISWPEGVVDVEVDELEEVIDKPGTTTGTKFSVLHLGFWIFGWLGQRVAPFFPFNMWTWHRCWMGIYPTQIFPCSSLTVAWHSCGWWSRRAWGRCRMINLLSWRCHWGWRMRTGGRTRWKAWNHDRNEVLSVALYSNTIFNEMWFLTVDPLIWVSMFIP